jgi:hypothetical protein
VNTFVVDTTSPTVDNISSSTEDGGYPPGEKITVTVGFNETVIVDNSSGNPRIQLAARSDNNSYANYVSGNSSSILSFSYTVQLGDNFSDLDYKATDSLSANSGTIRDIASNDANLTLASPGGSNSLASNKAFVYGGYKQEAYMKSLNRPNKNMSYGYDVEIYGDTITVGAYMEKSGQTTITNGNTAASDDTAYNGAVYVYTRDNESTWSQQSYIKPSNAQQTSTYFTYFGFDTSLENDTLVVGAQCDYSNQTSITNSSSAASTNTSSACAGAVFVYTKSGTDWSQQSYIKSSNGGPEDQLGRSVALSGDTIVAGANKEDTGSNDSGAAYVFTRSGTSWSQQAILKASNSDADDQLGNVVDIDGDTIVVWAEREASNQTTITNGTGASSNNSNQYSGAVYVFTRSGTSWSQQAYIKSSNNAASDFYGSTLSLDGDTLAVGSTGDDGNQNTITNGTGASSDNSLANSGAVFVYTRSGTDWSQQAYIKPSNAAEYGGFGSSVSLQGDLLVVGTDEDSNATTITNGSTASSDTSSENSGAVYVFKRIGTSWSQIAYIKAVNADAQDSFGSGGSGVAIDNSTIVVGSRGEASNQLGITNGNTASSDNSNSSNGAVYVYRLY